MRRRSYILCENIEAPTAYHLFADEKIDADIKKQLAKKLYDLFSSLKRSQISHGDLKAQNILCPESGSSFIDLDGMKSTQSVSAFYCQFKRDIMSFQRSWGNKAIDAIFKQCCDDFLRK